MRLRIFILPGKLPNVRKLPEECLAKVSDDRRVIAREGIVSPELISSETIITNQRLSNHRALKAYFSMDYLQVGYYLGEKKEVRQAVPDILSAIQTGVFEKKKPEQKINLPYLLMFIKDVSRPLLGICAMKGKVSESDFIQAANKIAVSCSKRVIPTLVSLENQEIIQLVSDYLDDGYKVIQAKTNLSEGKISLTHPENIFRDRDIQEINDALLLEDKIDKGDWLFLKIVGKSYAIAVSKTSRDVFTLQITEKNVQKGLLAAIGDIFSRIYKTKKGQISLQTTLM